MTLPFSKPIFYLTFNYISISQSGTSKGRKNTPMNYVLTWREDYFQIKLPSSHLFGYIAFASPLL